VKPSSLIKKASEAFGQASRSTPAISVTYMTFGNGIEKTPQGSLTSRTDEHGNIEPYEPDDEDVIRSLFRVRV
jgi:hypothetical protein